MLLLTAEDGLLDVLDLLLQLLDLAQIATIKHFLQQGLREVVGLHFLFCSNLNIYYFIITTSINTG